MTLREEVRAVLAAHVAVPPDDAAALALDSFTLIALAEDLEQRFGFVVGAREVTPDHFGSVERLVAFVARKRG